MASPFVVIKIKEMDKKREDKAHMERVYEVRPDLKKIHSDNKQAAMKNEM